MVAMGVVTKCVMCQLIARAMEILASAYETGVND